MVFIRTLIEWWIFCIHNLLYFTTKVSYKIFFRAKGLGVYSSHVAYRVWKNFESYLFVVQWFLEALLLNWGLAHATICYDWIFLILNMNFDLKIWILLGALCEWFFDSTHMSRQLSEYVWLQPFFEILDLRGLLVVSKVDNIVIVMLNLTLDLAVQDEVLKWYLQCPAVLDQSR